jgi:hypothetical protein
MITVTSSMMSRGNSERREGVVSRVGVLRRRICRAPAGTGDRLGYERARVEFAWVSLCGSLETPDPDGRGKRLALTEGAMSRRGQWSGEGVG